MDELLCWYEQIRTANCLRQYSLEVLAGESMHRFFVHWTRLLSETLAGHLPSFKLRCYIALTIVATQCDIVFRPSIQDACNHPSPQVEQTG
jgi:hypothetical protein